MGPFSPAAAERLGELADPDETVDPSADVLLAAAPLVVATDATALGGADAGPLPAGALVPPQAPSNRIEAQVRNASLLFKEVSDGSSLVLSARPAQLGCCSAGMNGRDCFRGYSIQAGVEASWALWSEHQRHLYGRVSGDPPHLHRACQALATGLLR